MIRHARAINVDYQFHSEKYGQSFIDKSNFIIIVICPSDPFFCLNKCSFIVLSDFQSLFCLFLFFLQIQPDIHSSSVGILWYAINFQLFSFLSWTHLTSIYYIVMPRDCLSVFQCHTSIETIQLFFIFRLNLSVTFIRHKLWKNYIGESLQVWNWKFSIQSPSSTNQDYLKERAATNHFQSKSSLNNISYLAQTAKKKRCRSCIIIKKKTILIL